MQQHGGAEFESGFRRGSHQGDFSQEKLDFLSCLEDVLESHTPSLNLRIFLFFALHQVHVVKYH